MKYTKKLRLQIIGSYARGIREKKGYSQTQVAEKLEVSQGLISMFEQGKADSAYLLYGYEIIL